MEFCNLKRCSALNVRAQREHILIGLTALPPLHTNHVFQPDRTMREEEGPQTSMACPPGWICPYTGVTIGCFVDCAVNVLRHDPNQNILSALFMMVVWTGTTRDTADKGECRIQSSAIVLLNFPHARPFSACGLN